MFALSGHSVHSNAARTWMSRSFNHGLTGNRRLEIVYRTGLVTKLFRDYYGRGIQVDSKSSPLNSALSRGHGTIPLKILRPLDQVFGV